MLPRLTRFLWIMLCCACLLPQSARALENTSLIPGDGSSTGQSRQVLGNLLHTQYTHVATSANNSGHTTDLDHVVLNSQPTALVFETANWNPNGVGGVYNDHPTGVWYTGSRWSIFNQDFATMPTAAAFDILIPEPGSTAFTHQATAATITSNYTIIDHPTLNNDPNAIIFVTQNWASAGIYNAHNVGVWYTGSRWSVFNQDGAGMPENAGFNVLLPTQDRLVFIHTATTTNTFGNYTLLDHYLLNGRPSAQLLITQNWNPGGQGGIYNNHAVGVWYSEQFQQWSIYNQDQQAIPAGAAFNVLVTPFRVYLPITE